ncbi:uncharacterized protein LY89DRAFT_698343 [Mollisia scopiformis]|uniref:Prokaryotic-type class I peptide chain release factors domain-containing protein n=1 Tax=Mollisia scopiformis TaxID=149040 RepID=A0A194X3P7_MOLSC|nr:uncharacterized protein LY89DRAFT_698343 [Mollisia scopiformis]KUJ14664.1 hypothetical protein LY89DRAFT_698343 [Mollisia scopiformis]
MLPRYAFNACSALRVHGDLSLLRGFRTSSHSKSDDEEADFEAAREWYKGFNKTTIPSKIAETSFSRASGPGGQKTNKTSSKATTTWPLHALLRHVPKVLHQDLRACRYYVPSSDSITIQCDTDRNQSNNREETYQRLTDEIAKMYKKRVPGVTSLEQKKRVENLMKADNAARLRMKKSHGDKKRARSGGGGRGGDF